MKSKIILPAIVFLLMITAVFVQGAGETDTIGSINLTFSLNAPQLTVFPESNGLLNANWITELSNKTDIMGSIKILAHIINSTYGEHTLGLFRLEDNLYKRDGGSYAKLSIINASTADNPDAKTITIIELKYSANTDVKLWHLQEDGSIFGSFALPSISYEGATYANSDYLTLTLNLSDFDDNGTVTYDATTNGVTGSVSINAAVEIVEMPIITTTFSGTVFDSNSTPVNGGLITATTENNDSVSAQVTSSGTYSLTISGPEKSIIWFAYNGVLVAFARFKSADTDVLFGMTLPPPRDVQNNYPDQDRDGIPNANDLCPGSNSSLVDRNGCTCEQKCPTTMDCKPSSNRQEGIICTDSCRDSIQNQGETGVDCGGPCEPCTTCNGPDTCLAEKPKYCSQESTITNNCANCGCPEGFNCESTGECTTTVETKGLKCYVNRHQYGKGLDCASLGPTYKDVGNPLNFIQVSVKGFIKPLNKKIKKKINSEISSYKVCIDTKDMGCVLPEVECSNEENWAGVMGKAQATIQGEVNNRIKTSVPKFLKYFGTKVKVSIDMSSINLKSNEMQYECAPEQFESDTACKQLIQNGQPEQKADILFIGDGFLTEAELASTVNRLLDYEGAFAGTAQEGLFSREPLKSNKEKFNIWIAPAGQSIRHAESPNTFFEGLLPDMRDVYKISNKCIQANYIVVLSYQYYRSQCLRPVCKVSLNGEAYPGRILLHEFGHGFANLEDEYYNYRTLLDDPLRIEGLSFLKPTSPNCKTSQNDAQTAWGDLVTQEGNINYFASCGGDCDQTCQNYIRPTFNSVMRNDEDTCIGQNCISGPPFEDFYAVNDREFLKELARYS